MRAHISDILRRISLHDSGGRGAQLGFFTLLAAFPLVLSLVGLLSAFHLESQLATLESFVERSLPSNQAELVMREAARIGARSGLPLAFGMLVSSFYASRGMMAILRGVALAWRRPPVRMWKAQLASGVFGAGMLIFALLLFTSLMVANLALAWFRKQGVLTGGWEIITFFRWPILLLTYHALVRVTYRVGAGPKWNGNWFSPGSVLATVGWAVLSQVFEAYIGGVMDLGATYGSLGGTVGLLLYFHVVSALVFVGAEVDAHLQCGNVDAHRKPSAVELVPSVSSAEQGSDPTESGA